MPNNSADNTLLLRSLSQLTLNPGNTDEAVRYLGNLTHEEREHFESVADSNHVVVRALQAALPKLQACLSEAEKSPLKPKEGLNGAPAEKSPPKPNAALDGAPWARQIIARQEQRIQNALPILQRICEELENAGCPTTVMKSLDHWPDLGNDLDLFTTGDEKLVRQTMVSRLGAKVDPRSWGDRLANKWNFCIPGLPELIEVHAQRLGQTGEQTQMAKRFVTRRVPKTVAASRFWFLHPKNGSSSPPQRMYRHFYFRVCDIVNTAALLDAGEVDFPELRRASELGGIWNGVATYLKIVCDYVKKYRGTAPELPAEVLKAADFGGDAVYVGGRFLRIPVVPNGAKLYTRQVTHAALRGDVPATLRLSLLPPLASAAAVAYKLTGSDKGVW